PRSEIHKIQEVMKRSVAAHAKTLLKKRQGTGRQVRPGGEPGDARVSPEPGFLAAGGAAGGPAAAQDDGAHSAPLPPDPGRPHPVAPRLDPPVEFGPVDAEPDLNGGAAG